VITRRTFLGTSHGAGAGAALALAPKLLRAHQQSAGTLIHQEILPLCHPAVTVARTGTTKAGHMLDNIGGGIGRLPNGAMRKRMAELVDSLPAGR
jgi:hypothetical protein